jgi:hypothetical protein
MPATIKRVDQQRHELKALRYIMEMLPQSVRRESELPSFEDFQVADNRRIFEALLASNTKAEAAEKIRSLDLEDTNLESFLQLENASFYYAYPGLVKQRAADIREGKLELIP